MAYLTEKWNQSLHNVGESKIVALDISKAFDRVWHQALLSKMRAYGIDVSHLQWIRITFRTVQYKLCWVGSSLVHHISAGIPHGSVLSRHSSSFL